MQRFIIADLPNSPLKLIERDRDGVRYMPAGIFARPAHIEDAKRRLTKFGGCDLRKLRDFADEASSDGRFAVGSGGNDQVVHLSIVQISDGQRVFLRKDACCPDWNR